MLAYKIDYKFMLILYDVKCVRVFSYFSILCDRLPVVSMLCFLKLKFKELHHSTTILESDLSVKCIFTNSNCQWEQ